MIKGIDVSSWQTSLPSFDGDFVIIRGGYATTEDSKFKEHYNNAIKRGKKVGVYWYSYALNKEYAKTEAHKCLDVIKGLDISMGVWIDMEDADEYKKKNNFAFTKINISTICNAFCEIIENAGYYSGIYASYNYLKNYISCPKYDKWVAYWGSNSGTLPTNMESTLKGMGASIWQYTSKLNGKNLDGDVLLHNDINMYNVQPKGNNKIDFTSLASELKSEINKIIDNVIERYKGKL